LSGFRVNQALTGIELPNETFRPLAGSKSIMSYLRSIWRITLWTCASLVILGFITIVTVRVRRYILRQRAEMLLADMESISLRQTTFRDVQPILLRWRRWAKYDGPCSQAHCTFDILLSGFDTPLNRFLYDHGTLLDLAIHLGESPTAIRARFTVLNGVVWSEGIAFGIETRGWGADGRRYVEEISGEASSVSKLDPAFWGSHWHLHPDYSIRWPTNLPNQVRLQFTPFANPADIHRLMVLDFSCLTRLVPCRDKKDIMPVALAQVAYWQSLPDDSVDWERQCDDPMVIELLARDSRNIVIAHVTGNRLLSEDRGELGLRSYQMTLVLQRGLKTSARWNGQMPLKLPLAYPLSVVPPQPGTLAIVFFKDDSFDTYSTAGCSPLPLTPAHLSSIRRGIAEDSRPSGLPDYAFQSTAPGTR
jgi:hypothetical protein